MLRDFSLSWAVQDRLSDPLLILFVVTLILGFLALRPRRSGRSPGTSHVRRRKVRAGFFRWFFFLATVALFLLCSAPIVVEPLIDRFESRHADGSSECALNAPIVVLAGGLDSTADSAAEFYKMTNATMLRSLKGMELAKATDSNRLILSGGSVAGVAESEVMADFLVRMGFPDDNIVRETQSHNTWQSALEVSGILNERTWPKEIVLVTSALHMDRASQSFAAMNLKVCTLPVDYIAGQDLPMWPFVPNSNTLFNFDKLLHEWLGLSFYRIQGRI